MSTRKTATSRFWFVRLALGGTVVPIVLVAIFLRVSEQTRRTTGPGLHARGGHQM